MTLVCCSNVVSWRAVATSLIVVVATSLVGCATQVRQLMPTPALYHSPAAKAVFEGVPAERRSDYVDLLYVTDRAPDNSPEAELPYGEERSRSLAFGSAQVALRPTMGWEELERHSLSDPRDQQIAMEVSAIKELGRYPTEPYPVEVVEGVIVREPNTLAEHERIDAALQAEVQRRFHLAGIDHRWTPDILHKHHGVGAVLGQPPEKDHPDAGADPRREWTPPAGP
jgi:hypothetical protein